MLFDDVGRCVAEHTVVRTVPRDRRVPPSESGGCACPTRYRLACRSGCLTASRPVAC